MPASAARRYNVALRPGADRRSPSPSGGLSQPAFWASGCWTRCAPKASTPSLVQRSDAPTTMSVIGVDANGVPRVRLLRRRGAADRTLPREALACAAAPTRALLQFGSYAMVVEPVAAAQRALIEREHDGRQGADRLRPERAPERRARARAAGAQTLEWMLPRTAPAEDERRRPGPAVSRPRPRPHSPRDWLGKGARLVA